MGVVAFLILVLLVVLPVGWLVSEFYGKRWVRLVLGTGAIMSSIWAAYSAGTTGREWEANAWYGAATVKLVDTTVAELEKGNTRQVVTSLKELQAEFHPNYDHRSGYDQLVETAVKRMGATTRPGEK